MPNLWPHLAPGRKCITHRLQSPPPTEDSLRRTHGFSLVFPISSTHPYIYKYNDMTQIADSYRGRLNDFRRFNPYPHLSVCVCICKVCRQDFVYLVRLLQETKVHLSSITIADRLRTRFRTNASLAISETKCIMCTLYTHWRNLKLLYELHQTGSVSKHHTFR